MFWRVFPVSLLPITSLKFNFSFLPSLSPFLPFIFQNSFTDMDHTLCHNQYTLNSMLYCSLKSLFVCFSKTVQIYFLTALEARRLQSVSLSRSQGVLSGWFPLETHGENVSSLWRPPACLGSWPLPCLIPTSCFCCHILHSLPCVQSLSPFKNSGEIYIT